MEEIIKRFVNRAHTTLADLFFRWQDESEYEDLRTYAAPLARIARDTSKSVVIEKMTKRPFGVKFHVRGVSAHMFVKKDRAGKLSVRCRY